MQENDFVQLDRFWLPSGMSYSLSARGWLNDPTTEGLWNPNAHAVSTKDLAERRCLVLLGEPGMGKSSALEDGEALHPAAEAAEKMHVDLGTYATEERLVRRVFESSTVEGWRHGDGNLCLTLDSFDEAQNRIESLDRLLGEYLQLWDCDRLFLRVVCRTAEWPRSMRGVLQDQFGEANIHELLPLRRTDAAALLSAQEIEPEQVLKEVERARIVPLAARPLTLRLIRTSINPDGTLPSAAKDLYDRGLNALLDEMNPGRQGPIRPPGALAGRRNAAERIAALSLFGGLPSIWTGPVAQAGADELTVDSCVGPANSPIHAFSQSDVDATLRSGVFTGSGEGRLAWSHATFTDFLAAHWILGNELSDKQAASLLTADDGRIFARVREVASWLVVLSPTRFRHLIQSDPQAFLVSVDLPDATLRKEIVAALLIEAEADELLDQWETDYSGLVHHGLADLIRPALTGGRGDVCRLSIRIARDCSVGESLPDLTRLALNDDADLPMRTSAAMAVHDISTQIGRSNHDLVSLVASPSALPDGDENQELTAASLLASWPHAISTAAVFSILSPTHSRSFFGLYSMFVGHFARGIRAEDLDHACTWLLADLSRVDDSRLSELITSIVQLCVDNIGSPPARDALCAVAFRRLAEYAHPFEDEHLSGHPVEMELMSRRAVVSLLLERASEEQALQLVHSLPSHSEPLIQPDDLEWIIDLHDRSRGRLRTNAGRVAQAMYQPELVRHSTIVLGLADDHPAAELFIHWRSTIRIDSEAAAVAREQHRELVRRRERLEARRRNPAEDEWVNPKIGDGVRAAAAGRVESFWHACRLVTVRPGTLRYTDEHQPDLTKHPRWQTLPDSTKADFVVAALAFLENGKCEPDRWLGQNKIFFPARAGYRALVLLLHVAPENLKKLSPRVWREWAPIIIDWTTTINGASDDDKRALLAEAKPHASDELHASILKLIDRAIVEAEHVHLRTELDALSSAVLAHELIERLQGASEANTRRTVLDHLVDRHLDLVAPLLRSWLNESARAHDQERAYDAVSRLLQRDANGSWPLLSRLLNDDPTFMESAMLASAQGFGRAAPSLSPGHVAELYLWLREHFPPAKDPQFDDAHVVGARESLGNWRDSLLSSLEAEGSLEAVRAIESLVISLPDMPWMSRILARARRARRDRSWAPLSVSELDRLAADRSVRIVRSDADLHAATMEALDAIQARLQADTPSAHLLWDTHAARPKAEDEISDYLSIELAQRLSTFGVIVNREVQVRRSKSSGLGERTDLRIEAIDSNRHAEARGTIRIPAEVKGVWNSDLYESMSSQLVQRYMADFQTNCGIYVVAWFDQKSWSPATTDGRRAKALARGDLAAVRAKLESEAEAHRARGLAIGVRVMDFSLVRPESHPESF